MAKNSALRIMKSSILGTDTISRTNEQKFA